jgi:hypothetical protein
VDIVRRTGGAVLFPAWAFALFQLRYSDLDAGHSDALNDEVLVLLDLARATVTIDAIGYQKDLVKYIRLQQADDVLTVKDNQAHAAGRAGGDSQPGARGAVQGSSPHCPPHGGRDV